MAKSSFRAKRFWSQPATRLILTILVALGVYYFLPISWWEIRLLLGFNLGLIVHLGLLVNLLWHFTPEQTYRHAQKGKPSNIALLFIVVLFSFISLIAIALMLDDSKNSPPAITNIHMGLSSIAIFLSWLLVNIYYSIHYAYIYYDEVNEEDKKQIGDQTYPHLQGLEFPQEELPSYRDFLYYSFTIAMCYQTSDISIISSQMRDISLLHAIFSFIFVAVILGLVVNIVTNLV